MTMLDLIACSLLMTILLLIIALDTGKGYEDNLEQATLVELVVYGVSEIVDNDLRLQIKNQSYQVPLVSDGLIFRLDTLHVVDSLGLRASLIDFMPIPDTVIRGDTFRTASRFEFGFLPQARGLKVSLEIKSSFGQMPFLIETRLTNTQTKKGFQRKKLSPTYNDKVRVEMKYLGGTRVNVSSPSKQFFQIFLPKP